ncbi:MAG: lytic murein transglycosylase [Pseudomonadota bacterium]
MRALCLTLFITAFATPRLAADAVSPEADFAAWRSALRGEALAAGIAPATFDAAFEGVEPDPKVIALDRNQPEFTLSLEDYLAKRVTPAMVDYGAQAYRDNADLLQAVGAKYGINPRFIAGIWGMETSFGRFTGGYGVIRSLATLAFDDRRPDYFRRELINALKIIDEDHFAPTDLKGSWAGAMGQSQFMPSSFLVYAQDFDGDGKRDIWGNRADVFASIAHYLASHGWRDDLTWGRPVLLPADFAMKREALNPETPPAGCRRAMATHTKPLTLGEWQALGLRRLNGAGLPTRALAATLVQPDGAQGRAYIAYDNFRAILAYNCSNYYAIAVGTLADKIAEAVR